MIFLAGKSCSISSNTWTPTSTSPSRVSEHAAWRHNNSFRKMIKKSSVSLEIDLHSKESLRTNRLLVVDLSSATWNIVMFNNRKWKSQREHGTTSVTWTFTFRCSASSDCPRRSRCESPLYLVQSEVGGNCGAGTEAASHVVSVRIVGQKTKAGEAVLRNPETI